MTAVYVRTQNELDKALANPKYRHEAHEIDVCSPSGVWLKIRDSLGKDVYVSGEATVEVSGDVTVKVSGDATVNAVENATVEAFDNASISAFDNATVKAWSNATVNAFDNSTVEVSGDATVTALEHATVNAWSNATVNAFDNSTINAWDCATVNAWDRASVRAWDRATANAWGDATVEAGICVVVYVHSKAVAHKGGVVIDMTAIDASDPETWCAMHLVEVDEDGQAHLYKALDADLNAGHNYRRLTNYPIGHIVDDTANWVDNNRCGNGLHASLTPWMAKGHYEEASRFVEVCCPVEELRPINSSKAKAPRFRVLREVTIDGSPVGGGTR